MSHLKLTSAPLFSKKRATLEFLSMIAEWSNVIPLASKTSTFAPPIIFLEKFENLAPHCRYPSTGPRNGWKGTEGFVPQNWPILLLTLKTCRNMCNNYVTIIINSFLHKNSLFISIYVHFQDYQAPLYRESTWSKTGYLMLTLESL